MKKFLGFIIVALVGICGIYVVGLIEMVNHYAATAGTYHEYRSLSAEDDNFQAEKAYLVYVNDVYAAGFDEYNQALDYAVAYERASILDSNSRLWVWDNYPGYSVFYNDREGHVEFYTFIDALNYAKEQTGRTYILYQKDKKVIWSTDYQQEGYIKIEAPLIRQNPELPRGCEVTSLAMLLNARQIPADKMELAERIAKDMSSKTYYEGMLFGPDPTKGFIGDMYNMGNYGLGVYHQPIYELLLEYVPRSAVDLTGCDFEDLYYLLNKGAPVWVIINSTYQVLPQSSFERWMTEKGEIQVTYRMHSVLVTGYSEDKIFFNDPYGAVTSANKQSFIAAWEQMGRQAVAVTPDE